MEGNRQPERPLISRLVMRHGIAACEARALQARRAGLGGMGGLALTHLIEAGELTAAELGRRLVLGAAETLALVEVLEQDGFVARRARIPAAWGVVLVPAPLAYSTLPPVVATVPELVDPQDGATVWRFCADLAEAIERAASSIADDEPG